MRQSEGVTIFRGICGFGRWCDLAWWRSVVTHLMQEVNGFANQQDLTNPEGGDHVQLLLWRNYTRLLFISLYAMRAYLARLVHRDERGNHRLPEGVFVMPQAIRLHVGI